MNSVLLGIEDEPGFSFRNCRRNDDIIKNGFKPQETTKTGTTIVGICFKDGVVLGADTRATSGNIVVEKNCQKIFRIQDNIYCCGAGTAADMQMSTMYVQANMELHRLNTNRKFVPVVAAVQFTKQYLRRYQGHIKNWLLFGGVDNNGPQIHVVHPHGSSDPLPYGTMGSGSLAAMSIFETRWRPDLNEVEGVQLVRDAVFAGIFNDLGSGSNVDICIIRKNYHKLTRGYEVAVERGERKADYTPKRGTTGILSCKKFDIEIVAQKVNKMEVDE